jgi:hypothetical protein
MQARCSRLSPSFRACELASAQANGEVPCGLCGPSHASGTRLRPSCARASLYNLHAPFAGVSDLGLLARLVLRGARRQREPCTSFDAPAPLAHGRAIRR